MLSFQLAHEIFIAMMWGTLILALSLPMYWVLFALVMPRSIINRYLKEPYFSWAEITIFSLMPGKMVFAAFTAWVVFLPNLLGRRRNMVDVRNVIPWWYVALSLGLLIQVFLIFLIIATVVVLIIFAESAPDI